MKKLWHKGTRGSEIIEKFTIGKDQIFDLKLARFDVLASIAHSQMLLKSGLINIEEQALLQSSLVGIMGKIDEGDFRIKPGVEDVHSEIELQLTKELGDIGKKIHTARSRNDQVLVDLRLFFRSEIEEIASQTKSLFDVLLEKSEKHKEVLMPGYTHMQVGMVSSFGLWFSAFAESLADDLQLLLSAFHVINQNPLGSGAGYGSSLPIDRRVTTELLGFENLSYNSIHAQFGRGKSELFISFGMAALAGTINKLASDICLFVGQNFDFVSLPDKLTTGSSIMPHKKNPDVFELIRGKCNQLLSLPQQIITLTSNLPSGYHRDFQLLKEVLFPCIDILKDILKICTFAITEMQVKMGLLDDPKYIYLYTVEEVNKLVMQGVPFREAYRNIGDAVQKGTFTSDRKIAHSHQGSIGNLCLDEIAEKMESVIKKFQFGKINEALEKLLCPALFIKE